MDFTIKPKQEEIVINKHTASIFIDTGFERMLRNASIITVVFTGIATKFGVESSARGAFNRGFYSAVISDCVSSPDKNGHNRSLENMKNLITVINSKELENIWSGTKKLSSIIKTTVITYIMNILETQANQMYLPILHRQMKLIYNLRRF